MSKFVVIEGLDGAGKSTQIKLLTQYLAKQQVATEFVHFPRVGTGVFGEMTANFLRGDYGPVEAVHPQLVALMFAEDRADFAATVREWLADGRFVLMDRYVLSNIAFQCGKLEDPAQKEALRQWILHFEYQYRTIPQPALNLFLDVPWEHTRKALGSKRQGEDRDYLQGKDDIHEASLGLQQAVKAEYTHMLNQPGYNLQRIVCYNEAQEMLPPEAIHQKILEVMAMKGII